KTFKEYPQESICAHVLDPRYTTFRTQIPGDFVTRQMNMMVRYFGQPVTNTYEHHNVHPHLTLAMTDVNRLIHCVYPTGPRTCRYYGFLYSLWGEKRGPLRWLVGQFLRAIVVWTARKVFAEDATIFGAVQGGLESSPFPGVVGVREERIHVF